jgi:hypothetical protein
MSEVARVKVLEDVLLERERQDTSWDARLYGYTHYIQLASICFAMAELCKEEETKNEKYG